MFEVFYLKEPDSLGTFTEKCVFSLPLVRLAGAQTFSSLDGKVAPLLFWGGKNQNRDRDLLHAFWNYAQLTRLYASLSSQ